MTDPTFRSRSTGEPRVSIDLDDIERRLRESLEPVAVPPPAPAAAPASSVADPLAEASDIAVLLGSLILTCLGELFKFVLVGVATLPLN
jgi:hypothetical protein